MDVDLLTTESLRTHVLQTELLGFSRRDWWGGGAGAGVQVHALSHDGTNGTDLTSRLAVADWAGNPISGANAWSLEMWTRMNATPNLNAGIFASFNTVVSHGSPRLIGNGDTQTKWGVNPDNWSVLWGDSGDLDGTNWNHLTFTFDPSDGTYGRIHIYKNGVSVASWALTTTMVVVKDDIWVFRFPGDVRRPNMDCFDLRVWSKFRSVADVLADFDRNLNGGESNLEAWFRLNDGSGDPVDELENTTATIENTGSYISWSTITDPR